MDWFSDIYTHPLFSGLSRSALNRLSEAFSEYTCDEGAILYYRNDGKGAFYLFLEGEFCSATADNSVKEFFFPGDYTDPEEIFADEPYSRTMISRSPGRYLKLEREALVSLSGELRNSDFQILSRALKIQKNEWSRKKRKTGNTALIWRKSGFYLFERLQYPFYIFMAMGLLRMFSFSFPYQTWFFRSASLILFTYSLTCLFLWLAEKYTLKGRELSSQRFSLNPPGLRRITLPVDQICGIKVEKKKLKNRFFNVGNLHIQTAAGTVLLMEHLDRPQKIEESISAFLAAGTSRMKDRDRVEIRKRIEKHFEVPEDIHGMEEEEKKTEKPEEIIFRKSVYFLFFSIWWQMLSFGLIIALFWIFRDSGGAYLLLTLLPFLAIMLWRLQDWRNDLYKVAGGKIIDINRKPFGKSEITNLADIGYVTNIKAEKKGVFQYLFNFGDVEIETAGGKLLFETVADPVSVQYLLLQQRELWKEHEMKKQRDRQFNDFLVYSEIYKQAEEQNRLNRLTPPYGGGRKQGV
ncbi:MAG: cyclic nucleotide-binding domain-containing protein [Spirochaetales bacterium]|nr:cyclic nucleotide-binding domain-containing protein [Spirochaetales bacterium]